MVQVQKAQVAVKRQPSMTDRMLIGQKLNFKELHDDDIRRQVLLHDTPYFSDVHPQCHCPLHASVPRPMADICGSMPACSREVLVL